MRSHRLARSVGLALLLATSGAKAQNGAVDIASANLPAITVSTVERMKVTDRVFASGLIGPVERVLVQPQIEGQAIDAVLVEVGDRVEAQQPLARLSDTALVLQRSQLVATRASAEASIAQAEALIVEAQATRDEAVRVRDRAAALSAQGAATESARDEAAANAATALARVTVAMQGLNSARAQLNLVDAQIADVDLQLERTLVTTPVAGEVIKRTAMVGAIATGAGEPLFEIIRDGLLELRSDVAEEDILRLAAGQSVQMRVVGLDAPLSGAIHLVEPSVDEATRLGRVRISIDTPGKVRAGMFADAEILVSERSTLAVPVSAVGGDAAGATALRVRDGVVALVPIVTGIRDGGVIEVVEGLAEGDSVVTKAGAFVRHGDRINPVPAEPAGTVSN